MHTLGNRSTRSQSLMVLEQQHRLPHNPAFEALVADFDAALAGVMRSLANPRRIAAGRAEPICRK